MGDVTYLSECEHVNFILFFIIILERYEELCYKNPISKIYFVYFSKCKMKIKKNYPYNNTKYTKNVHILALQVRPM
jgi:hypothetical protein